ncbi:MAG TPA: DNA mismatch repair protein MutS [Terriglobia bacterium]
MNPSEEYQRRLSARQQKVERYRKLDHLIGNIRLGAGFTFFLLIWLAAGPGVVSGWWLLVPIIAFIVLVARHERIRYLARQAQRSVAFYERGVARIEDRWIGTGDPGLTYFDESHPYATDLDLFGKGSLFELLSSARTRSGEQTLAGWLKAPAAPAEIAMRQRAVDELRANIDLREDLAVLGEDVRAAIHPEWMKRWGSAPAVLHSPAARVIAPILGALIIVSLVDYFAFYGSGWFVLAAIAAGGGFGLHYRPRVRDVTDAVADPVKDLAVLSLVLSRLEKESWQSEKLRKLRNELGKTEPASRSIGILVGRIEFLNWRLSAFFAVIAPLFMWATQFAFAIEAWRAKHGSDIGRWLEAVGELEALCSLAAYAYEHPDDPFPEILESGTHFEGDDMRHPLIPGTRCVANSVRLDHELQLLIVSGSNMSGKSTLLRTLGVNVVLALAGAPVRTARMKVSVVALGATIRVLDSLQAGTSRFYAEIQRLRQIMDLTKTMTVLFLLDEILHGTNSHDRAVGAEGVIRGLIDRGAIGIVTTHDLSLAKLAEGLAPRAANFHFQDQLIDGRMVFDYRLHPGVVQKSNALALMRAVGLEV